MDLLATTSGASISGLREQILANAVAFFPEIVKICEAYYLPTSEAFQLSVMKEHAMSATVEKGPAGEPGKLRYCAILTVREREGRDGRTMIAAGEAKHTVAETLGSLLDVLATALYGAGQVANMNRDGLFSQFNADAAIDVDMVRAVAVAYDV
ncbi:hypothetical protein LTR08_000867 [Meristemomyces frigidus]|nr:hypothetical protein LTR08_000867 [Meristemomyces frigidus]